MPKERVLNPAAPPAVPSANVPELIVTAELPETPPIQPAATSALTTSSPPAPRASDVAPPANDTGALAVNTAGEPVVLEIRSAGPEPPPSVAAPPSVTAPPSATSMLPWIESSAPVTSELPWETLISESPEPPKASPPATARLPPPLSVSVEYTVAESDTTTLLADPVIDRS